jgi:TolA-binding protein
MAQPTWENTLDDRMGDVSNSVNGFMNHLTRAPGLQLPAVMLSMQQDIHQVQQTQQQMQLQQQQMQQQQLQMQQQQQADMRDLKASVDQLHLSMQAQNEIGRVRAQNAGILPDTHLSWPRKANSTAIRSCPPTTRALKAATRATTTRIMGELQLNTSADLSADIRLVASHIGVRLHLLE